MRSVRAVIGTLAAALLVIVTATTAQAISGTAQRLSGADRYSTAVAISQQYPVGVPVAYVATGTSFADALSAAPAAAISGGPLLLTAPGALPDVVRSELSRLKPQKIVVVGGDAAISPAVVQQLATLSPSIRRDAGADRYETSRVINLHAFSGGASSAIIATGTNFPDALSASAAGGALHMPVMLVPGAAGVVDGATTATLHALGVGKTFIVGGPNAVSTGIENSLRQAFTVERIQGSDRYATSLAINTRFFSGAQKVYFASGTGFADALAGAALAGRDNAPLITTPPTCVNYDVLTTLDAWHTGVRMLLGGTAALSDAVAAGAACWAPSYSGDGDLRVGPDIPPGTYFTPNTSGCYWERVTVFGGGIDTVIANDFGSGQRIVTIRPSDYGFSSQRCGSWTPIVAAPRLVAIPGDGIVKVGDQVPSGIYRASNPTGSCYWARLSGFSGEFADIIVNGSPTGQAIVTIQPSDIGFDSQGCGTWTKIG